MPPSPLLLLLSTGASTPRSTNPHGFAGTHKHLLLSLSRCGRSVLPGAETLPRPVYIAADLGRVTLAAALEGSGFDPSRRTLFTCEGLVYYLPEVRGSCAV